MSRKIYQKEQYQKKVTAGICARCWTRKAKLGKTRCIECAEEEKEISKQVRENRIINGECVSCREPFDREQGVHCTRCLNRQKELRLLRKSKGKCRHCNNDALPGKSNCQHHLDLGKLYRKNLKNEVFAQYNGYICTCCGETIEEFLAIDHINGGGTKHRAEVGSGGTNFYRWLKKNNYPKGYQVLCANCNWGRKICGECPHKLRK